MPTICVTGLCLGGNKGGPAILSSITSQLKEHFDSLEVILISTSPDTDRPWQDYYQVDLAHEVRTREVGKWLSLYRRSDLILDMHGVNFVGPMDAKTAIWTIIQPLILRALGVPLVFFTQSYGPFVNILTKVAAAMALRFANLVFARETSSLELLSSIGLARKVKLFPDIAWLLPVSQLDEVHCDPAIKHFVSDPRPYVGVSLSTKILREELRRGLPPRYEQQMTEFVSWLLDRQHRVLLIPHTHNPNLPSDDDLGLALRVAEALPNNSRDYQVVRDDLPPADLKTLISGSCVFVGSRYHSLVAAFSTSVPTIAIGWTHKYKGLLRLFDMEQYVSMADKLKIEELKQTFNHLMSKRHEYSRIIKDKVPIHEKNARQSVDLVASLLTPRRK